MLLTQSTSAFEYYYMWQTLDNGAILHENCHWKIPDAIICFEILSPFQLLVPLVYVITKRNEDVFLSFSKIDSLDQVMNFNII